MWIGVGRPARLGGEDVISPGLKVGGDQGAVAAFIRNVIFARVVSGKVNTSVAPHVERLAVAFVSDRVIASRACHAPHADLPGRRVAGVPTWVRTGVAAQVLNLKLPFILVAPLLAVDVVDAVAGNQPGPSAIVKEAVGQIECVHSGVRENELVVVNFDMAHAIVARIRAVGAES